ncbi:leucine-rich repeat domain-containing protein [Salmonella enterica]
MINVENGNINIPITFTRESEATHSKCDYQTQWQQWEKNAQQGNGELRDIAVARLTECLENKSSHLDLSHLQLSTLPRQLPPNITNLRITGNSLSHISDELLPLLTDQEPWQTSGRAFRLSIEDELDRQEQSASWCLPPVTAKAGAILAGTTLLAGFGTWFFHQQATANTSSGSGNAMACRDDLPLPGALPLQAVATQLATPLRPPLTEKKAITLGVVNFLMDKGEITEIKPSKEVIIAAAANWLFPQNSPGEPQERVIAFARSILQATGHYGGQEKEALSLHQAKAVNRQWFFTTLLDSPLREYIAKKISEQENTQGCKLRDVKEWLTAMALDNDGLVKTALFPMARRTSYTTMLKTFIRAEIPLLNESKFIGANGQLFSSYDFLAVCAGADYLTNLGIVDNFTFKEITSIGASIWGKMSSDNPSPELLPYLVAPSLWFVAQTTPELVRNEPKKTMASAVATVLEKWKSAQSRASHLQENMAAYQTALKAWNSKGKLADKFIARCPIEDISFLFLKGEETLTEEQKNTKIRENAKERYLAGYGPPCYRPDVPVKLTPEYERLTNDVADAWKKLDYVLIGNALTRVSQEDYDFLFSADTTLRPASLHMRTNKTPASGMGGMARADDIFISLINTDLIAAQKKNDKRIYGLKRGKNSHSGYRLIRLDRNINTYINNGVLSMPQLWGKDTVIEGKEKEKGKVFAAGYEFDFEILINRVKRLYLTDNEDSDNLIEYYSEEHRNNFYNSLYSSGKDLSQIEKIWDAVKHVIPFYDCIEGVASGKPLQIAEALPSCFLDLLTVVPVAGNAAALSGKYGLSLVQAIRHGVFKASKGATIKSIIKTAVKNTVLPAPEDVQSVLKGILRTLDPGLETLYRLNSRSGRLAEGVSDSRLAEKLKRNIPDYAKSPAEDLKTAYLPDNGPQVTIKKAEGDNWVMADPLTGEAFGKYYTLENNKLNPTNVRFNRPSEKRPEGPSPKRPKTDINSNTLPVAYNKLPSALGKTQYWGSIRGIAEQPLDLAPAHGTNKVIQKMNSFLPERPMTVGDPKSVRKDIFENINSDLDSNLWRAWTGVTEKPGENAPEWITTLREKLSRNLNRSIRYVDRVKTLLDDLKNYEDLSETAVGKYLIGILGTEQPEVLKQSFIQLRKIVERSDAYLKGAKNIDYKNFIIVSTDLVPDKQKPGRFFTLLNEETLKDLPAAFVVTDDPEARIIFYADVFLGKSLRGKYYMSDIVETIIHETTHIAANTDDRFVHFLLVDGEVGNGAKMREDFLLNLTIDKNKNDSPRILDVEGFDNFLDDLRAYQKLSINLDDKELIAAVENDPMLFANAMMSDAQVNARMIKDLAKGRPFDVQPRPKRETTLTEQDTRSEENEDEDFWLPLIIAQCMKPFVKQKTSENIIESNAT